jgi:tetraacyldisaccharide 4'-kinase
MTLLELLYHAGYAFRKRRALQRQKRLPFPVISIGNITVGGTGKTPAVIALAQEAKKRGLFPCILTRGYRGKAEGTCIVSTGDGPLMDARQAGDEAFLMARTLTGIPVVKGRERYDAGMLAVQTFAGKGTGTDAGMLFILDDGFQHWQLYRDLDVVLIDRTNPLGNRRLLPSGRLREPLSSLGRASVIVLTRTSAEEDDNNLTGEIRKYNSKAPVFSAAHMPLSFGMPTGGTFPVSWAKGKRFFGVCGVGNPLSFQKSLLQLGADLSGFLAFRDHHRYRTHDLKKIAREARDTGAEWIVTTEKDIMRLSRLRMPENLVFLAIEFSTDPAFYNDVFTKIESRGD